MRNLSGILLILALLAVFLVPGMLRPEGPAAQDAQEGSGGNAPAATVAYYYPIVARQLTPTPSPTPTSPPTATPRPYQVSTGHLSGDIYFAEPGLHWNPVDQRYHFYTSIDPVRFFQWFFNNSSDSMERYKISGVNVRWPDGHWQFHTSITGAPDYVLPRCYGPKGDTPDWVHPDIRCGSDIGSGQHLDYISYGADVNVSQPGQYLIQFNVCQSNTLDECIAFGEWHRLGNELQFIADPAPAGAAEEVTLPPLSKEVCQLIMTDETHGRLECVPREP